MILHPNANAALVQMVYNKHVSIVNNNVHVKTEFGNIIDYAPLTFYQNDRGTIIDSQFIKNGNTVSFQLANYDNTKTVIIDPWVKTPTYTTNWDCVWECEYDGVGNVYTFGGVTPVQITKYNAAGTLQWTYNTPYDTSSWIGTFKVDNIGNTYATNGSSSNIR